MKFLQSTPREYQLSIFSCWLWIWLPANIAETSETIYYGKKNLFQNYFLPNDQTSQSASRTLLSLEVCKTLAIPTHLVYGLANCSYSSIVILSYREFGIGLGSNLDRDTRNDRHLCITLPSILRTFVSKIEGVISFLITYLLWILAITVDVEPEINQIAWWAWSAEENSRSLLFWSTTCKNAPKREGFCFNVDGIFFYREPCLRLAIFLRCWWNLFPLDCSFKNITIIIIVQCIFLFT